jgi:thiamine biosynthesis protein ThiI
LITFDKLEIIDEAKRRGTHDLSIQPADDCCTLFADRKPSIAVTDEIARFEEAQFPLEELEAQALAGVYTLG